MLTLMSGTLPKDDRLQVGVSIDNESLRRQQDRVRAGLSRQIDAPRIPNVFSYKDSAMGIPKKAEGLNSLTSGFSCSNIVVIRS